CARDREITGTTGPLWFDVW
nr:immunoglobulin heavy chain junction region [Macaca mulatta]MOW78790.1 immunoglobulin heavy chain junction region [Macaca mulatta]MOW83656.1 immunoglobulin heavy chain junction region [Macaca mulatta]MOW85969.1 immunoglobulin heavy chain junction region [Macaca mulatta]